MKIPELSTKRDLHSWLKYGPGSTVKVIAKIKKATEYTVKHVYHCKRVEAYLSRKD